MITEDIVHLLASLGIPAPLNHLNLLLLDGTRVMTGDLDLGGNDLITTNLRFKEMNATTFRIRNRADTSDMKLYLDEIQVRTRFRFPLLEGADEESKITTRGTTTAKVPLQSRTAGGLVTDAIIGPNGEFSIPHAGDITMLAGKTLSGRVANFGDGGTTNYTEFKTDGELVLHGTAKVMKCLNIEPKWTKGHGASPPDETTEDNSSYFFVTHDYDDTTEESVYYVFQTNHDYAISGLIHIHFDFFVDTAPATAKSVTFGVEYKKVVAGTDAFDFSSGTTTGYVSSSITTGTPANDKLIHQAGAVTLSTSGWNPNDIVFLRFFRDATGAGGTDDFVGDVRVFNYHLEYVSDVIGEAT